MNCLVKAGAVVMPLFILLSTVALSCKPGGSPPCAADQKLCVCNNCPNVSACFPAGLGGGQSCLKFCTQFADITCNPGGSPPMDGGAAGVGNPCPEGQLSCECSACPGKQLCLASGLLNQQKCFDWCKSGCP